MALTEGRKEKIFRYATLITLSFMLCKGLYEVLLPVKPFWVDEWRIMYNLKFKSVEQLWGPLSFMQQFPRVYLHAIKLFTQKLNYSYFSLRFPSFLAGTCTILICYRLMDKIFTDRRYCRFLFVLIIISASTFIDYFVQVKQYTMEILLSVVAIYQLFVLLHISNQEPMQWWRYLLLCTGFSICPFLSYTYPIVIAPAFAIIILESIAMAISAGMPNKTITLIKTWFPLLLCTVSIVLFYRIDVCQVMKDSGMKQYWGDIMMVNGFHVKSFLKNSFVLFAQVGAGLFFQVVFGILGCAALVYAIAKFAFNNKYHTDIEDQLKLYCAGLLTLVLLLYAFGKLPVGEARLNSFTIPAIALLIIFFIAYLGARVKPIMVTALVILIYAGTTGNIYSSAINTMTGGAYKRKLGIYQRTDAAIKEAQTKHIPLVVTSALAYPYDTVINFPGTAIRATVLCYPEKQQTANDYTTGINMPADWVIKTLPAYDAQQGTPVYAVDNIKNARDEMKKIPSIITQAVLADSSNYAVIKRN